MATFCRRQLTRQLAPFAVLMTTSLAMLWLTYSAPAQTKQASQKQGAAVLVPPKVPIVADVAPKKPAAKQPTKAVTGDKRPLTHDDYNIWNTIQSPLVAPNGFFVAYTLVEPEGTTELIVVDLKNAREFTHSAGKVETESKDVKDPKAGKGGGQTSAGKGGGQTGAGKGGGQTGVGKGGGQTVGGKGAGSQTVGKVAFTDDSKRLLFSITPGKGKGAGGKKGNPEKGGPAKKADPEEQKEQPQDAPQPSLGIMDLSNGSVKVIKGVRSFQIPEVGGAGVIYHKAVPGAAIEEKKAGDDGDELEEEEEAYLDFLQVKGGKKGGGQKGGGQKGAVAPARAVPSDLVLHNFENGSELTIPDVTDYTLTRDGQIIICTTLPKDEAEAGVYAYLIVSKTASLANMPLVKGKAKYSRFTWDEKQQHLAFFADYGTGPKEPGPVVMYLWDRNPDPKKAKENPGAGAVEVLNSKMTDGLKDGCILTERGNLSFTDDGTKIIFSVAPPPPPPAPEAAKGGKAGGKDGAVVVELWHWNDDFIQPMQKMRTAQEKNRTYTALYNIKNKKIVQLADKKMPVVTVSRNAEHALGSDDTPYRHLVAYDGNYSDIYIVNTTDGGRKPLVKKAHWGATFSPGGKFASYFDGKDWNIVNMANGATHNVTSKITYKVQEKFDAIVDGVLKIRVDERAVKPIFSNEEHDSPSLAPAYGIAGWSVDEANIYIYDKYDIWEVNARGSGYRDLTGGLGRSQNVQFRYVKLDPKEKSIDLKNQTLLRFENYYDRTSGFAVMKSGDTVPESKVAKPLAFGTPSKAKYSNTLLFTAQNFFFYPDLYVTDLGFKDIAQVSNVNPHKEKFNWGLSEVVHYKNADGVPLSGILIRPENFDPTKKYPMMVYIYERLSQNVHHFVLPKEGTSINATYYASNGYLVFMPDIAYTIGYPGQSALKCVLPGIQAVVDRGIVNENAIGIQGHSWGGYQIAYMVTQTGRFKAAAAGAAVSDMISAYDGIRWGTGLPRQFQYEKTQSRIGGTLWEYPMRFVENSPVFMADRVKTPLLLLHNDQDDAVPWYQGIEYYLALRRLGKEVYLFNYPGELHGLRSKANQKDYTIRMQQFFDHHLRGAPAPDWMVHGIPYTPRGPATTPPAGGGDN